MRVRELRFKCAIAVFLRIEPTFRGVARTPAAGLHTCARNKKRAPAFRRTVGKWGQRRFRRQEQLWRLDCAGFGATTTEYDDLGCNSGLQLPGTRQCASPCVASTANSVSTFLLFPRQRERFQLQKFATENLMISIDLETSWTWRLLAYHVW